MVKRKTHTGSPDITDLFRLEVLDSRNFAREQKRNASMVDTKVNILGTDRAKAHINFPSHLFLPQSLF